MHALSSSRPRHDDGPLTLEVHDDGAPAGWDGALAADGGVVFHCAAWADHKGTQGGEPLFCVWRDQDGGVAGRALGIRRPPSGSRAGRLAARLVFDSPPTSGRRGADFVRPLSSWARRHRALIEVGLGSFDAIGSWTPGALPRPQARIEYVVPDGDADDVWGGMRSLARRKVKKAEKGGLECRAVSDRESLRAFAAIYETTLARLNASKGVPTLGLDLDRHAASLAALVDRGHGRLYAALRDGELVAATLFATFGARAYLVYSGATDAGRDDGAPFLILSTALRELRADGFPHLNLGGAAPDAPQPESLDHGLHQFKTRFGAAVEERTSGSLLLRPARARLVGTARRVVRR